MKNSYDGECRNPRCEQPSRAVPKHAGRICRGAPKPGGGDYWDTYHEECFSARNRDPLEDYRDFVPSKYQAAVAEHWRTTDSNLIVDAVAGSGKTKTILWVIASAWADWTRQLGRRPQALLCAFNRSIRDELVLRLAPGTAAAMTLNSFGFSLVRKYLRAAGLEATLESRKVWDVARDLYPKNDEEAGVATDHNDLAQVRTLYDLLYGAPADPEVGRGDLVSLCSLAFRRNGAMRMALVRLADLQRATLSDDNDRLVEAYGVELPWQEGGDDEDLAEACVLALYPAVECVLAEMERLAVETGLVDYTDQIWLPHRLGLRGSTYDAVFVDEAQDLNEAQLELIKKAAGPHGRMIFVGDPYQAIYGFRGAGVGMIDRIETALEDTERGVKRLPLNYCYRCPTKVIDAVRGGGRVMHIEASPGQKAGEILFYSEAENWTQILGPGAMILCRTNAPLALTYFQLLREKIPAQIRGRGDDGIHKNLMRLIDRSDTGGPLLDMVERACKITKSRVVTLWNARRYNEAIQAGDLFQTLAVLAGEASSVRQLRRDIETVFSPDTAGAQGKVTLSSIHKAKGLEAPDVFIIRPDLLPLMHYAKTRNDIEQEKNLEYVAFTRAMNRLVFVTPRSVKQRSEELEDLLPGIKLGGKDERQKSIF